MRIIKKRGNELATVLVSTYLHQLRWCATHFMQRYDFLRNMQNTFDFSFLATVKNNLSVSYPGHKGGTVSLWKVNKGQAGLKQTVTRTVRKGLHTGITVWYRAGDDFVPKSKKRFFFQTANSLTSKKQSVAGARKRPAFMRTVLMPATCTSA